MAQNMVLPIYFDLEQGVKDAANKWNSLYAKQLEDYINKRPVKVNIDFQNLEEVKSRLASLKFEPLTPETKSAIKNLASELQSLAKALETLNKYTKKSSNKGEVQAAKIGKIEAQAASARELARQRAAKAELAELKLAQARERAAQGANKETTSTKKLENALDNQIFKVDNLIKQFASLYAVNYFKILLTKVREVTAEFELQRISLGAILQDQVKANQLFSQIKTFALRSPVKILDLTKYTKQLAAYKIGYEELFDTTKRLTDISVGLGVSMDRIVLLYGQVRATGYLRACLGKDTPVKMYDGSTKAVQDVVIGDKLMGDNEQPRVVSELFRGRQQMYRVKYNGGEFRCNEHHVLTLYNTLTRTIEDVYVFDILGIAKRNYKGIRRVNGKYEYFDFELIKDNEDDYFGFSIDGNKRFIICDDVVTHNSEIRQATEAGIPLVESLATKLSQAKGELVSAADVMDMVSKRAISFEMVKDVFNDMTSAGGLFYNMQEKQGNTLYGLWAKLGDAASLMFDEIGNTEIVNDSMKTAIYALTDIMRNWKVSAAFIVSFLGGAGFAAIRKFSKSSSQASSAQQNLTKATQRRKDATIQLSKAIEKGSTDDINAAYATLEKAKADEIAAKKAASRMGVLKNSLSSLWKAVSPYAGALFLATIAAGAEQLYTSYNKLKKKLNEIESERFANTASSIRTFERLADTAVYAADGSKKQKDALDELQRTYKDMIPVEDLSIENLRKLRSGATNASDAYKVLTSAIREYIAEQSRQKKVDTINEEYGIPIKDSYRKLRDYLIKGVKGFHGEKLQLSDTEVELFFKELEKRASDTGKTINQKIRESLLAIGVTADARQILNIQTKGDLLSLIKGDSFAETFINATKEQANQIEAVNNAYSEHVVNSKKYREELERIANVVEKTIFKTNGQVLESNSFLRSQLVNNKWIKEWANSLQNNFKEYGLTVKKEWLSIVETINTNQPGKISEIDFDEIFKYLNSDEVKKKLGENYEQFKGYVQAISESYNDLVPSNQTVVAMQGKLFNITANIASGLGSMQIKFMDGMKEYFMNSDENIKAYAKRIKEAIESIQSKILEMNKVNKEIASSPFAQFRKDGYTEEQIKQAEAMLLALQQLFAGISSFASNRTNTGKQSDPRLQNLKEEISLTQKLSEEYKRLEKLIGSTQAKVKVNEIYTNTISTLQKRATKYGFKFEMPFDDKALKENLKNFIAQMKKLQGQTNKKGKPIFPNIGKDIDEAVKALEDIDLKALEKSVKEQLQKLADKISRTKTAKEFYEKILKSTDNEELAYQATFSVYGMNTLEAFTSEVEQLEKLFDGVDISGAINTATRQIDYKKLRAIWTEQVKLAEYNKRVIPAEFDNQIKSILDAGDKLSKQQIERWSKDLQKAKEYADKRIDLAQYTVENIAEIEAKRDSLDPASKNYAAQVAMYNKMIADYQERERNEAAKLDYEQVKEQIGMFDDLGVRIGEAFTDILDGLRKYTQSADFARLGADAQKSVYAQIAKIEDRMAEGFQGIGVSTVANYVREYSYAAGEYLTAQEELKRATLAAIEADKKWNAVRSSSDEEAKAAALAEKQLADSRVRTAGITANAAAVRLQTSQDSAARASNKFSANLNKVEESLKSLSGGALKTLWDLVGEKGKRNIGNLLSGSKRTLKAIDDFNKKMLESGLSFDVIGDSVKDKLVDALAGIDPKDLDALKATTQQTLTDAFMNVGMDKELAKQMAEQLSGATSEALTAYSQGQKNLSDAASEVANGAKKGEEVMKAVQDGASATGKMWGAIISLILSLLDEFGENGVGTFLGDLLDDIAEAVEGILSTLITDAIPKILAGVANVVKGVVTGLGDMLTFGSFDLTGNRRYKKAEKEIAKLQEEIDSLSYSMERLDVALEDAFGVDYIRNFQAQLNNLQQQASAYQKQAEAEKSKSKKADKEKIKDYEDSWRDTMDEIADMQSQLAEQFAGTSRTDLARNMAKSWIDARISMSNTFDAIASDYKDMITNMLVEGAAAKIIDNALTPVYDEMERYLKQGDTESATDALVNGMDAAINSANSGMELFWQKMEAKGYDLKKILNESDSKTTGISKSVSSATSEEINANTAALNTQNFYMSNIDSNVAQIAAMLRATSGADALAKSMSGNSAGWTDWQQQAMDNYNAIARNTAENVIECRRAADACERIGRALGVSGAKSGLNVILLN